MKPALIRIVFTILISSCAANRIGYFKSPDQLADIKSGHFKKSELTCTSPKIKQYSHKDINYHSVRSEQHRHTKSAMHRSGKGENILSSFKKSNTHPENMLVYREARKSDEFRPDIPLMKFPLMQIGGDSAFSRVISAQLVKGTGIIKKHPAEITMPVSDPVNQNPSGSQPDDKRQGFVYLMVLSAGLLTFAGIKLTPELTASISVWAALNPGKARFIISAIQIMTGMAGLFLGMKLANGGTHFSDLSKGIIGATFITTALLYPVRKSKTALFKRTYLRQKIHDLVLFFSGFLFMVYAGNYYSVQLHSLKSPAGNHGSMLHHEYIHLEKNYRSNSLTYSNYIIQAQDDTSQKPEKGRSSGEKVLLSILTFMAAMGLGYGVAALSCQLSCSGLNGLAVIVAIAGIALIAAFIYFSMKAIFKPKHDRSKSLAPA